MSRSTRNLAQRECEIMTTKETTGGITESHAPAPVARQPWRFIPERNPHTVYTEPVLGRPHSFIRHSQKPPRITQCPSARERTHRYSQRTGSCSATKDGFADAHHDLTEPEVSTWQRQGREAPSSPGGAVLATAGWGSGQGTVSTAACGSY